MKKTQETLRIKDSIREAILYTAFELSLKKWKLAFSNGEKMRTVTIDARNLAQLHDSGSGQREQGISKPGNVRVRTLAVEMAWVWLRFQSQSKLSQWYLQRFAEGGKRMRRIGIVAMARRLLIDLWRYLEHGVVPEGARLVKVVK